jgi:hypothetical protein
MGEIVIPFQGQFRRSMVTGEKRTTWRTRAKGNVGDTFWAFGRQFEITAIVPMTQGDVLADNELVCDEGFTYAWELRDVFEKLYRRAGGYDPDRTGFLHTFKILSSSRAGKAGAAKDSLSVLGIGGFQGAKNPTGPDSLSTSRELSRASEKEEKSVNLRRGV